MRKNKMFTIFHDGSNIHRKHKLTNFVSIGQPQALIKIIRYCNGDSIVSTDKMNTFTQSNFRNTTE